MDENRTATAVAFYKAMGEKNISAIEKYIHPDIRFITPLGKATGKEAYLEGARGFAAFFKTLTVRAQFGSEEQAMVVYDLVFPEPIGNLPSAALLTFQGDLIAQIELFYDARPFEKK